MKLNEKHGPMNSPLGKSRHKYIWRVSKRKFSKNLWRVMVPIHGKRKVNSKGGLQKNVGYFVTLKEAIIARDEYLISKKI